MLSSSPHQNTWTHSVPHSTNVNDRDLSDKGVLSNKGGSAFLHLPLESQSYKLEYWKIEMKWFLTLWAFAQFFEWLWCRWGGSIKIPLTERWTEIPPWKTSGVSRFESSVVNRPTRPTKPLSRSVGLISGFWSVLSVCRTWSISFP